MLKGFGFALSGPAKGGVASASACAAPVQAQSATNVAPASAIFGPGIFMVGPSYSRLQHKARALRLLREGHINSSWEMPSASSFEPPKQRIWDAVVAMQHRLPAC